MTWVGHSTLLVRLDGVSFLTDPQWSKRASPVSFAGPRRVVPPGLRFEDLPPIDLEPPIRVEAEGRRLSLDPERIWIFRHGGTRPW